VDCAGHGIGGIARQAGTSRFCRRLV